MRDFKRIAVLLRILQIGWEKTPDWRFGQLIENFKRYIGKQDLFYIEDEDLMEDLIKFFEISEEDAYGN